MATSETAKKPVILIVCNYYLPGYKAGGGLRTVVHMVERFRDKFDFRVITLDHDGDGVPYSTIEINKWNECLGAQVYYLSKDKVKLSNLRELIQKVEPQAVYLNSVFSSLTIFLLVLRKLKLVRNVPVILAPEGELSDGALQLKPGKKAAFSKFAKATNLYRDLIWKVTAEPEKIETERFKGSGGEIYIAPNMPSKAVFEEYRQDLKPEKKVGEAKMIFLSRYARKKNFKWLLEILKNIDGKLMIDIFGPIEDEIYWQETVLEMKNLPANINIEYKGFVSHEEVLETIFNYHFFVLPTLGENFGHVFVEAMAAGCPLLISNRTPWVNLEQKRIGWDLPLENPAKWIDIFNYCISLGDAAYTDLSSNARQFAYDWLNDPAIEESTLKVLMRALETAAIKAV